MGYVFDFQDARTYAQWVRQQRSHWTVSLQNQVMLNLLNPAAGESALYIGCGTGTSAQPLLDQGLSITGIDPSPYMLDIARETVGRQIDLYRGHAEELPFEDNSFNYGLFFLSLEFVEDPATAIEEACRVAKDRVFICFINRYALKGLQLRLQGIFSTTLYNRARFFSVWELKRMLRAIAGPVPVAWRTVCQLPGLRFRVTQSIERCGIIQHCPFGAFGGLAATLVPQFRTRPLKLLRRTSENHGLVAGGSPVRPLIFYGENQEEEKVQAQKTATG